MASTPIKDLLERYRLRMKAPQGTVIKEVVTTYQALGIRCSDAQFSYAPASRTITLKVTGPQKTEMLMRKAVALHLLETALGSKNAPKDII